MQSADISMSIFSKIFSLKSASQMRIVFLFLTIVFLDGCTQPQKTDEEKERGRLVRNHIKRITEYKTSFLQNLAGKEQISHLKIFNTKGFVIKEIDYNESGSAKYILAHEYDKNNNLIYSITKNSDSSLFCKEVRRYGEKNKLKELIHFLSDGTVEYKHAYLYDEEGRMVELEVFWPEELSAIHKFTYERKKKLEYAEYSADKKLLSKISYKYDSHGNLMEAIQSGTDSSKSKKIIYLYNLINQITKQAIFSGESLQNTLSYEYDKKYFLSVKIKFSSTGKITTKYRYQYDFF